MGLCVLRSAFFEDTVLDIKVTSMNSEEEGWDLQRWGIVGSIASVEKEV